MTTQNKLQIYDVKMSLLNSVDFEVTLDICITIQKPEMLIFFGYNIEQGKFVKFQVLSNFKIKVLEEGYIENLFSTILTYGHDNQKLIMCSDIYGTFKQVELSDKKFYLQYKGDWKSGWTSFATFSYQNNEYFICYKISTGDFSLCKFTTENYREIQNGNWGNESYDHIIDISNQNNLLIFCYSSKVGSYTTFDFSAKLTKVNVGTLPKKMKLFKVNNDLVLLDPNNGDTIFYKLTNQGLEESLKMTNKDFINTNAFLKIKMPIYITAMSFNVWDSSYRTYKGIEAIAKVILENNADIVGIQEMGSEEMDNLQKILGNKYTCNYYTGIVTKYSLKTIYNNQKGIYIWGGIVELSNGKQIKVLNSHLTAYPYGPYKLRENNFDPDLTFEQTSSIQGKDIQNGIDNFIYQSHNDLPILLFGDHNIPSHLDHDSTTSSDIKYSIERNCKVVPMIWPVSFILSNVGFIDSFREVHPDVLKNYGFTWTSGYPKGVIEKHEIQDRIDYIYYQNSKGLNLKPYESYTVDSVQQLPYPSDHKAVVTKFQIN